MEQLESKGQCAASFLNANSKSAWLLGSLQKGDYVNFQATYLYNPVRNVDDSQIPINISGAQIVLVSSDGVLQ